MPQPSHAIEMAAHLRLLVLGGPKVGKTHTVISTAPGPVYVINSDDVCALRPAARVREFVWDLALGAELTTIEKCLREAYVGVKEGRYQTIVWDTITKYAARVEDVFAAMSCNSRGEPDGRRYWHLYRKHLHSILDRLFSLPAHVVVNAHYIDVASAVLEGQTEKTGQGVVPLLAGQARATIPAEFQDVVFLEKRGGKRCFVTSMSGVFGPGCRNLPDSDAVTADVSLLWARMQDTRQLQDTKGTKQ